MRTCTVLVGPLEMLELLELLVKVVGRCDEWRTSTDELEAPLSARVCPDWLAHVESVERVADSAGRSACLDNEGSVAES